MIFAEKKETSKCNKHLPRLQNLTSVISIERNLSGQIYLVQDLDSCGHCTVRTADLPKFTDRKYSSSTPLNIPFLHVPSSTNYASQDCEMIVLNSDQKEIPMLGKEFRSKPLRPIETVTRYVTGMFENYLSECFEFENKKRSTSKPHGTKRKRHKTKLQSNFARSTQNKVIVDPNALPVVSVGWSTMDCNRYGANLATIAGNVRPFLCDGNLPNNVKKILAELIEFVLGFMPKETCFNMETSGSPRVVELRSKMISDFKFMLSGDRDVSNFRVEGVTILIPLSIGYHKDTLNCHRNGMTSVLSINSKIPLNEKTIPSGNGSRLWNWLNQNGYHDDFPCSIILYS